VLRVALAGLESALGVRETLREERAVPDNVTIHIEGKAYDLEDFEGREIIAAERALDISLLGEISRGSMLGVYAAVFMVKRRKDPTTTIDDVLALKLSEVVKLSEIKEEKVPPPSRGQRRAKKPS
jgi:hypothetical protein